MTLWIRQKKTMSLILRWIEAKKYFKLTKNLSKIPLKIQKETLKPI